MSGIVRRLALAVALVSCATAASAQESFYTGLLTRGRADAAAHKDAKAAEELHVAAFGLLDQIALYETAQMLLAVVSDRLGRKDDARIATARVALAERLHPGAGASIDPNIRADFEKLNVGRALSPPPRALTPPPRADSPPPRRAESPSYVAESPSHVDDLMQRALAARQLLADGDAISAQNLAEGVIARDINNGPAQAVLGTIAARAKEWTDAVDHFGIARTSVRLTPEETAAYDDAVAHLRPVLKTAAAPPPQPQPHVPAQPRPQPQPVAQSAPQPQPQPMPPAAPQPVSPLVAAAKRQPSQAPLMADYSAKLNEADRLLRDGRPNAAKQIYVSMAAILDLRRDVLLQVAQGLNQTSAWRESSSAYRRTFPLLRGEEIHMFHEAVNRYELGDVQMARELLQKALPAIPETREVILYRGKILGTR